jgi:hypothetical protein
MLKMKQRPRIYYTDEQKALMWDRWQKGESMNAILVGVHANGCHVHQVDHDRIIGQAVRRMGPLAAHGELEVVLAAVVHCGHDVADA